MPRTLAVSLLLLVLAACATDGGKPVATAPPPEPQPEPVVVAAVVPEPAPEPEIEPVSDAVIEAAIAAMTPNEPPEPAAPLAPAPPDMNDDPAQVMALDSAALEDLLGVPRFNRRETGVQVWQYAGASCVLDVYLYDDGPNTPYRVTYYEIRGDSGER